MSPTGKTVIAHREEYEGALAYEDLRSPVVAARLVLLPLCAEKLPPEKAYSLLRPSVSGAKLSVLAVPVLEGRKLDPSCRTGFTGEHACARCVLERWLELLGFDPQMGEGVKLRGPVEEEEAESADRGLKAFLSHNRPLFAFHCVTSEARPAATFKLSGQAAAVHLRGVLIVQLRGRAPSGEDAEKLFSCRLPEATRARRFGESDLLTVDELAAYLRVAPGTVRNWVSDNRVPYVKVGNQVRFLFKKVLEWLESGTNVPPSEDAEGTDPNGRYQWEK